MRTDPISEFRAGLIAIIPATLAVIPFGLILGAAAAQKGLSPLEVGLMGALVFAGGAQFVAVELWTDPASWLALGFAALLVNLRYVLMSASLAGTLKAFPRFWQFVTVFFLADETWAFAERRARHTSLTTPFLIGLIPIFYVNWVVWTVIGTLVGESIRSPKVYGLDFAFTAIFIGLAAGFWRGPRTGMVMAVSAVVSALTYLVFDGPWYVMTGAIAGIAAAVAAPEAAK